MDTMFSTACFQCVTHISHAVSKASVFTLCRVVTDPRPVRCTLSGVCGGHPTSLSGGDRAEERQGDPLPDDALQPGPLHRGPARLRPVSETGTSRIRSAGPRIPPVGGPNVLTVEIGWHGGVVGLSQVATVGENN